jgi:hypothetical protein
LRIFSHISPRSTAPAATGVNRKMLASLNQGERARFIDATGRLIEADRPA